MKELYFEGFKFKYPKGSRKKTIRYLDEILMNGDINVFRDTQKAYHREILHIITSYSVLFKIIAYFLLIVSIFLMVFKIYSFITLGINILSIISYLIHLYFLRQFKYSVVAFSLIESICDSDLVFSFKENTIEEYKNKDKNKKEKK